MSSGSESVKLVIFSVCYHEKFPQKNRKYLINSYLTFLVGEKVFQNEIFFEKFL